MYAMQYTVPLPADYDMRIIRDRVARGGSVLDGYPGLAFKAYLMREKASGAPVNEYAPFYVWNDIDGMRRFCWGGDPGFGSIVRDFGRKPIRDWTIAGVAEGPVALGEATTMAIRTHALPDDVEPALVVDDLARDFLASPSQTTSRRIAAVDVTTWTLLLAELGSHAEAAAEAAVYEVLHVSTGS